MRYYHKLGHVSTIIFLFTPYSEGTDSFKNRYMCLSPQCGFASCEIGNKLTEEQQWAKLKLVKEIAEEVWK